MCVICFLSKILHVFLFLPQVSFVHKIMETTGGFWGESPTRQ